MSVATWRRSLRRLFALPSTTSARKSEGRFRPTVEYLEDRLAPAGFQVNLASGFQVSTSVPFSNPVAVASGDLSLDNLPDLAVVDSSGAVQVLVNTTTPGGSATFGSSVTPVASGAANVAIGDVNNDNRPDLIVVLQSGAVEVLANEISPGSTTPSFASPVTVYTPGSSATNAIAVAVGDFNRDGHNDLAIVEASGVVAVLENTIPPRSTDVSFAAPVTVTTISGAVGVAAGDLNQSGESDLVVGYNNSGNGTVAVLSNQTAAGSNSLAFQSPASLSVVGQVLAVATGDVNNDGRNDLIITSSTAVTVDLNTTAVANTAPTFASAETIASSGSPVAVAAADLSQVGRSDIIVADASGNQLWVLNNPTWPAQYFAPYVNTTAWPIFDIAATAQSQGVRYFSLGFITASPTNLPAWGGYEAYDVGTTQFSTDRVNAIQAVRALGGDVTVSFGGAGGSELALKISTVSALQAAYQSVIDTYQLTHIDFDIEGSVAETDQASIDRRWQAVAGLESAAAAAGKQLSVSVTLPTTTSGLDPSALNILQSAKNDSVQLSQVNIMAMDYGPSFTGDMGKYAESAAQGLFTQLHTLYPSLTNTQLWKMIGVTAMIGVNDVQTEIFNQDNARFLLSFAQKQGIGELAFWSIDRDNQAGSKIPQTPFEFTGIFLPFTKSTVTAPWTLNYTNLGGFVSQLETADVNGLLTVFGIGGDGAVWYRQENVGNDPTSFGPWTSLGGYAKALSVVSEGSQPPAVIVIGGDNAAWVNESLSSGDWHSLGGYVKQLTGALDSNGKVELFAIGGDNAVYLDVQTLGTSFLGWTGLGGYVTQIAVGLNAPSTGGLLQIFAIGGDHAVWTNQQQFDGGFSSANWQSLGGYVTQIAVGANTDGTLQLFAIGGDHAVWTLKQLSVGAASASTFTGWQSLGGYVSQVAVGLNADGTLGVFAIGGDGAVWYRDQTIPGNSSDAGFTTWQSFGGVAKQLVVGTNPSDESLEFFAIGGDNAVYSKSQDHLLG